MPAIVEKPIGVRSYEYDICTSSSIDPADLPDKYTIPEENIPPVHDQKSVNDCVAFAMCQCAESYDLSNEEKLTHYSPSWNYGRMECRGTYKGEGMIPEAALNGTTKIGFISDLLFPDFDKDVPEILDICAKRDDIIPESSKKKINLYTSMNYAMRDKKWDTVRQALYDNKRAILITSSTFFRGGSHAIIAIGWSNTNGKQKGRYLLFQNSWNEDYKDNGRWYIPIEEVDNAYALFWNGFELPFTDVTVDDWFYDNVKSSYFCSLIKGVSDTEFKPNDNIIRGDVAVIISRLMDKILYSVNTFVTSQNQLDKNYSLISFEDKIDEISFKDVDPSSYYYDAINKVFANGIIMGDQDGNFNPQNDITRAEMSAIVVRMAINVYTKICENIHKVDIETQDVDMSKIKDVSEDDWFYGYVKKAYEMGFMNGMSEDSFAPNSNLTRAEASTVLYRLFTSIDHLLREV